MDDNKLVAHISFDLLLPPDVEYIRGMDEEELGYFIEKVAKILLALTTKANINAYLSGVVGKVSVDLDDYIEKLLTLRDGE